jgi:hypothetical protein
MECDHARLLLAFIRPGGTELDREEQRALDAHLAACPNCAAVLNYRLREDEAISRAMCAVPIPGGLQTRLLTRLANDRHARFRTQLARFAAAAAFLVAASLWFWPAGRHEPPLVQGIVERVRLPQEPAAVADWFQSHQHHPLRGDVAAVLSPFDFSLLKEAFVDQQTGQPVATLVFRKGAGTARVRLLTAGQYHPDDPNLQRYGKLLGQPDGKRLIALVTLEDGAKIDDFLKPQARAA